MHISKRLPVVYTHGKLVWENEHIAAVVVTKVRTNSQRG